MRSSLIAHEKALRSTTCSKNALNTVENPLRFQLSRYDLHEIASACVLARLAWFGVWRRMKTAWPKTCITFSFFLKPLFRVCPDPWKFALKTPSWGQSSKLEQDKKQRSNTYSNSTLTVYYCSGPQKIKINFSGFTILGAGVDEWSSDQNSA